MLAYCGQYREWNFNKSNMSEKKIIEYIKKNKHRGVCLAYCPVCAYELGLIKKIPDKYMDMIKRSSLCDTLMRRIKRIERNKCK